VLPSSTEKNFQKAHRSFSHPGFAAFQSKFWTTLMTSRDPPFVPQLMMAAFFWSSVAFSPPSMVSAISPYHLHRRQPSAQLFRRDMGKHLPPARSSCWS